MSGWNAYPGALPPDRSPLRPVLGLVAWIGLTFAVAAVGGAGSARAGPFYADLLKPAWAPPAWMFGPVWTALYVMMAVAAWQVWQRRGRGARRELGLYLVQLGLNALWTWLFFAWRLGALAFFELVLLVAVVAATGRAFGRIRRSAGILLLPYLAWLVYAAALAGSLWRRNPDLL